MLHSFTVSVVATSFACLVAGSAAARPYLPLLQTGDALMFLDLGTAKSVGQERWVWLVTVATKTPSSLGDGADVVAINFRFDCARAQMQLLGSNSFRLDRTSIQLSSTPSDSAPVPPDSTFSKAMDVVCDGRFNKQDVMDAPEGFTMFDLSAAVKRALAKVPTRP